MAKLITSISGISSITGISGISGITGIPCIIGISLIAISQLFCTFAPNNSKNKQAYG
ncbi:hypothetical protein [Capnocytophaga sp. oral taxon 902]|uniref:hypothetical protein n=1 Tax=Capnocytophaga sp. oral taxon 902 TaxID=2748316 RepID=UPI001C70435D|nr:hypothetical protein [Capnocytophaga sp. oral taxon 902]